MSNAVQYHLYGAERDELNDQMLYTPLGKTNDVNSESIIKRYQLQMYHGRVVWAVRSDNPDVWHNIGKRDVRDFGWVHVKEYAVPKELKMLHLLNV